MRPRVDWSGLSNLRSGTGAITGAAWSDQYQPGRDFRTTDGRIEPCTFSPQNPQPATALRAASCSGRAVPPGPSQQTDTAAASAGSRRQDTTTRIPHEVIETGCPVTERERRTSDRAPGAPTHSESASRFSGILRRRDSHSRAGRYLYVPSAAGPLQTLPAISSTPYGLRLPESATAHVSPMPLLCVGLASPSRSPTATPPIVASRRLFPLGLARSLTLKLQDKAQRFKPCAGTCTQHPQPATSRSAKHNSQRLVPRYATTGRLASPTQGVPPIRRSVFHRRPAARCIVLPQLLVVDGTGLAHDRCARPAVGRPVVRPA